MTNVDNGRFQRYVIQLWYNDFHYEGQELEMIDNEEIMQICQAIERLLEVKRENIDFDCEDIHKWYVSIDSSISVPIGRLQVDIHPFPKGESLFEENANGVCGIEIALEKC